MSSKGPSKAKMYREESDSITSLECTSLKLSSNSNDIVYREGPSKAIVSKEGPSKELLKWYDDATDEDATTENTAYEDTTDEDTTYEDTMDEDTTDESFFSKSKGKTVERTNNPTPTVILKIPIRIKGCVLGLANVQTWDNIVKFFGVRKPEGSCANKEKRKRKVCG
nr:hypothetical protein [Tanacetum cinerariifolium]